MGKQQDYISRVYLALKENLDGFNKDEPTFRKQMSDSNYATNVYTALSENLEGFNKTPDEFFVEVGLKKKDLSGQGSPSGFAPSQGIKPGTSVFPQQALGTEQIKPMADNLQYKYKKESGFGNQIMSSLEAGANTFNAGLAATPGFIYDVAGYPFRAGGLSVPKSDELKAFGVINSYIKNQKDNAVQIKEDAKIDAEVQKGIVENVSNGNYANAFKSAGLGIAESLPAMIGMALTGGMGGGGTMATQTRMALPFMSNQWKDIANNPNMSEGEKIVNAIVNGYSETVFEDKFGSLGLIKQAKKILATQGQEAAESFVKKGFKESVEVAAKKFFPLTAPISNALEEGSTKYVQNFNDLVTGKDVNKDLMEGVGEAMAQGGAFGLGIGGVSGAAVGVKKAISSNQPEIIDIIQQKLDEQLQSGAIQQEDYDAMQEYIAQTKEINTKIPSKFEGEMREKMIDLTSDRNILQAKQLILEQEASMADAAFAPRYKKQTEDLQAEINAYNDAILGLEAPIIYRQTEKGFERDVDGRAEAISEAQFNFAKDNKLDGIDIESRTAEWTFDGENEAPAPAPAPQSAEGRAAVESLENIPYDERTDAEHSSFIKQKFTKAFTEKGVPKEQVEAAVALMEARAKASGKGDAWYREIEDVGDGEFKQGTKRLNQIIGEVGAKGIKTVQDNLLVAKEMEQAGKDPKSIYLATGWERDNSDRKLWKYDLADIKSINKDAFNKAKKEPVLLGELIGDNELFNSHPKLKDVKVKIGLESTYDAESNTLTLSKGLTPVSARSMLLHEVQHAIQHIEGFAFGTTGEREMRNAEYHYNESLQNKLLKEDEEYRNLFIKAEELPVYDSDTGVEKNKEREAIDKRLSDIFEKYKEANPFNKDALLEEAKRRYYSNKGEVEARNVQNRSGMSIEERRQKMLSETADVSEPSKIYFQEESGEAKGAVETLANGRKVIHALSSPDFSTAVHEIAHVFESELTDPEKQIIQDWAKTKEWTTETSEAFARGFERYLRDGNAPTPELKTIFQKAKEWLEVVYQKLAGSPISKNITPELKDVFDNLFKSKSDPLVAEQQSAEVVGEDIENATGTYSVEIINTISGPEKRYYRKAPLAKLKKEEISEEEYNLNTGVTPIYDESGKVNLDVITNNPDTGLTDEQFAAVREKYYAKINNGGSPGQASQAAMAATRNYVGNKIITKAQFSAINKALLPIASQYTGAVRTMQNPDLAAVRSQKDQLRKAYRERRLGWIDRLKALAIDDEQLVLKAIRKQLGKGAKIVEAAFRNINRYSSKSSQVIKEANDKIFKGLSHKAEYKYKGKSFSDSELFSYFIQMDRIKNINKMMKDKYDRLIALKNNKKKTADEKKEYSETKKYLQDKKVLRYVAGGFELLPYEAGHSLDDNGADAIIKEIEGLVGKEKADMFKERQKLYADVYKLLIEEKLDAEIIDQEQYDAMSKYDYAPTMHLDKLIEDELRGARRASKAGGGNGLLSLKGGSESALSDAYDVQMVFDINRAYKQIFSNRAAKKMLEVARKDPNNGLVEVAVPLIDPVTKTAKFNSNGQMIYPKAPTGMEYIKVFEQGREVNLLAPAEFAEMFKSGSPQILNNVNGIVDFLSKATGVTFLRNLTTGINPSFGVYQTVMDMPQALIATDAFSPSFSAGMVQLGKEMNAVKGDVISRKGWFKMAEDYGALADMTTSEKSKIGDEIDFFGRRKSINNSVLSQIIRKGEEFNQKFEHLTRVAVFKKMWETLEKNNPTMSKEDRGILAAAEAGKVVDYSRGGSLAKFASKFIPYLNARMQVWRSAVSGYKNNPGKLGVHALEIMSYSSLALAYTLGVGTDDEDEMTAEYLALDPKTRKNNIIIRNKFSDDPDYMFLKLPIPTILVPIKTIFEESVLSALGKKEFDFENAGGSLENLSPLDLATITSNPMMNAYIKYAGNKDLYYDKEIVKNESDIYDWEEGQNNPKLPEMYKQIGKISNSIGFDDGVSPERMKAAVESFGLRANKNPLVSIPFNGLDVALAYASGNEEEFKQRLGGDTGDIIWKMSGLSSRVFAPESKIDAEYKKMIEKDTKDRTSKRNIDKVVRKKTFEKRGEDGLLDLLDNDESLDYAEKQTIIKTIKNDKLLKDRPSWYGKVLYSQSNDEKIKALNYFLRDKSVSKRRQIIEDLKTNFISEDSEIWSEIIE